MVLPSYVKLSVLSKTRSFIAISAGVFMLMGMTLVLLMVITGPI